MSFSRQFLGELEQVARQIDSDRLEELATALALVRERGGRLFFLGVGGSAANASHAACDFRKAAGFEAYAPTDNVAELTATVNDESWDNVFRNWLRISRLNERDAVFILSVGGGSSEQNVSTNLVTALDYAKESKSRIFGIVGRDGGYTRRLADCCILIPTVNDTHLTAHAEAFQSVLWHLLVTHPASRYTKPDGRQSAATVGRRAVFLDRDGVLVDAQIRDYKPYPPSSVADMRISKDAFEQLARLQTRGYLLPVITNQPDIRRGVVTNDAVVEMHRLLTETLPLDGIFVCPHDDADGCSCRKPKPGLLLEAAAIYDIDLADSYFIGDRWRDVDAGAAAGCQTILIDYHYRERAPNARPNIVTNSLTAAVDWILAR